MEAAVVSVSHGALGSLLGKLGDLLTARYKLLKEAKGQVMFLKAELESMQAFMKKISDAEEPDEQDKCWAKEVRELSYDIEDSVSEFMLCVERDSSRPRGFKEFISRSTKLLTTMNIRHQIAKEFEGLKIRVKEVSERHTRYKMDDVAPKENNTTIDLCTIDLRLLALHAETASLVGVKGPRDQLIQLMDEEGAAANQLKVLSIVGFGGLGKTTLANEIYRKLEEKFHCQAFISVSQKPNIRKILRTILSQVGFVAPKDVNIEMWEESELIIALKKFLLDMRYLIVIDDIWDASAWDIIGYALPENKNGSRVITTTRIEAVARACCANDIGCVYKMKALKDYTINKNDLTRQWVAEGFICKARGRDPEDIAKSYFNELINRSMIQPTDTDYNGEVISCRVHDMMLDLILHKSREENFITVTDDIQEMTGHHNKIRRLALNLDGAINDATARSVQLSQIRTVQVSQIFTVARYGTSWQLLPFKQFKHLRVLGIEISRQSEPDQLLDFTGIRHLFQLRFLKIISRGYDVVLPSKIGDLQQLESFDVCAGINSSKGSLQLLPSDIVTLSRLFHLIVPWAILPKGIANMKSLRTLQGFGMGNSLDNFKGLRELSNLTDLKISCGGICCGKLNRDEILARCREVVHALENLCNLKHLHIFSNNSVVYPVRACLDVWRSVPASFSHLESFHARFDPLFSRIPKWIVQLHSLNDLRLTIEVVEDADVGLLALLPSLVYLHLHIEGAPKDRILIRQGRVVRKPRAVVDFRGSKDKKANTPMEAAAVSVSHGAMGSLLGKLGELLTSKYKLLKEAKGQIMFLKAELESMYVFLKKISDTEETDEQDKCWAKEVRELSYDIEDRVSEFMLRVERDSGKPRGFKGFIKRTMKLLTTMNIRHEIAKEFEGLKIRVKEVSERHTRDQLIQLMDEEGTPANQLKVISIVGFGGLGKTTLANEIYRKLKDKFHCQAFVSVSQKPNISKIMRKILSQIGYVAPENNNIEMWEESELITAVKKFLQEKRYLIVIDDIWDVSAWAIIRCALPENNNGSRVITTTRIEAVARACCGNHSECVYKMKVLSDQDSRSLFLKRIFGSEDACPSYLNEVSIEILKKCGGLPLAIITISSMLANQPNKLIKEQWDYVRNSLGSNFEMSSTLEGMRQILNLSYVNLPHYLKTCMLYLGIYPEDYTIARNDLTRQWVAEGFVCKARGTDAEDLAKSYFNELINRSMIQPTNTDYNGEVIYCRVHDMILDLILHKSREENFVTVIDDIQDMTGQQDKIRRLSLNLDAVIINDPAVRSVQLSQTRTLAGYVNTLQLLPFTLFKHLRVLVFQNFKFSRSAPLLDFTGIRHLFQLRFLKIVANRVVLPGKIGDLQQLEAFQLHTQIFSSKGTRFHKLPSDIITLSGLFHLAVPRDVIVPEGIGNMKSLCTLRGFDLGNSLDNIKGLRELTKLTELEIVWSRYYTKSRNEAAEKCREVVDALKNLCNLKCLHFASNHLHVGVDDWCSVPDSFIHLQSLHVNFWHSRVIPEWIGQLRSLYDLELVVQEVPEDGVGVLARLPSLIHLYLHIYGAPKDKIRIQGGSGLFPIMHACLGSVRSIMSSREI
ncbi:hypothetical protein HU200_008878 [Digitaria exilis]|uniref:Disease resistance protein RPM1 n=1 Tax=Digitaria exilis TaxID=1010633 RepID=A0A835FL29_9POAL|nr:hypothetical protein HU200_008878 [Digitaria exilis]